MGRLLAVALLAGAASCGCTSIGPSPPPAAAATAYSWSQYRCDHDIEFTVRFADDTATVDAGARGSEQLLRDAGGVTPQQTVYSNPRLRAEFGLGASGGEALLHYLSPPMEMHCVRVAAP